MADKRYMAGSDMGHEEMDNSTGNYKGYNIPADKADSHIPSDFSYYGHSL